MNSGNLSERDFNILSHIGRYRISFSEVIKHLFFDDVEADSALRSLREGEYIKPISGPFDKNRKAFTITLKGARAIGLKKHLAEKPGPQVIHERTAVFCFCCLGGTPRALLQIGELIRLFNGPPPMGRYHALERSSNAILLYHLYAPSAATEPKRIIQEIRQDISNMQKDPEHRRWLDSRMYAHAILVQTDSRASELRDLLNTPENARLPSLTSEYNFCVERVPALGTLEEALNVIRTVRKTRNIQPGLFEQGSDPLG